MTLVARLPFVGGLLPDDPAARDIKRVQHPLVRGGVIRRIGAVVRAGLEGCACAAAYRARHEQSIAPDDRTRVSEPRNAGAPKDVLALLAVPAVGQLLPIGNAGRLRTAERRPVPGAIQPPEDSGTAASNIVRVTVRGGARFGSSGGAQRDLSRNIRRGAQVPPITQRAELCAVHLEPILSCGRTTVERNRHGLQQLGACHNIVAGELDGAELVPPRPVARTPPMPSRTL